MVAHLHRHAFELEPETGKAITNKNIEAEFGVLGSNTDPEAITQWLQDFALAKISSSDANRTIYEIIIRSSYEQRIPADFITICDVLEPEQGPVRRLVTWLYQCADQTAPRPAVTRILWAYRRA